MMIDNKIGQRLAGAVIGAAVMMAGVSASAEQPSSAARAVTPGSGATGGAARPRTDGRDTQRPWSIEDALPSRSSAIGARPPDQAGSGSKIGRVPLKNGPGSIGFETESKVKSTELPDGQRVPGLDTNTHKPPSYLGLSLSVPTHDKSILPPLFGRPD